ncbi:DUF3592 domain-containing protein [Aestuariibius sp. 2305UL40-4]|uniref:DUF3592 domain-containing protein n=1 Tax=Aestuariibius violaceus TaxID=3234132 RepID=UPI00345ED840
MRDGPEKHSVDRPKSAWALWREQPPRGAFFTVPILIYLFCLAIWVFADSTASQFEREGRIAVAEAVGFERFESQDSEGEWETTYVMEYFYEVDGVRYDKRSTRSTPWPRRVGDQFEIQYLASRPERIEVSIGSARAAELFLGWTLFGLSLFIGTLILVRGSAVIRAIRARRLGEEVEGRIVFMQISERTENGRSVPGRGMFRWVTEDGIYGSHRNIPHYVYGRYEKGDRLRLFRLGRKTWWEGDVGPRRLDESNIPEVPQGR